MQRKIKKKASFVANRKKSAIFAPYGAKVPRRGRGQTQCLHHAGDCEVANIQRRAPQMDEAGSVQEGRNATRFREKSVICLKITPKMDYKSTKIPRYKA